MKKDKLCFQAALSAAVFSVLLASLFTFAVYNKLQRVEAAAVVSAQR